eukprot:SAG11_NODE_9382_length_917_cov_1.632029_2_plen_61_part_01
MAISGCAYLQQLDLGDCRSLVDVRGLERCGSLREVRLSRCPKLEATAASGLSWLVAHSDAL